MPEERAPEPCSPSSANWWRWYLRWMSVQYCLSPCRTMLPPLPPSPPSGPPNATNFSRRKCCRAAAAVTRAGEYLYVIYEIGTCHVISSFLKRQRYIKVGREQNRFACSSVKRPNKNKNVVTTPKKSRPRKSGLPAIRNNGIKSAKRRNRPPRRSNGPFRRRREVLGDDTVGQRPIDGTPHGTPFGVEAPGAPGASRPKESWPSGWRCSFPRPADRSRGSVRKGPPRRRRSPRRACPASR